MKPENFCGDMSTIQAHSCQAMNYKAHEKAFKKIESVYKGVVKD